MSGSQNTLTVRLIWESLCLYCFLLVGENDKCKLYCRVEYSSAYYLLASSVTDGTPCGVDTYDMCVGGVCVAAGCDHVLGSSARLGKLLL